MEVVTSGHQRIGERRGSGVTVRCFVFDKARVIDESEFPFQEVAYVVSTRAGSLWLTPAQAEVVRAALDELDAVEAEERP